MKNKTDWENALKPLLKKYKNKKHPLEYKNLYQLLVMVVLSARNSDININSIAPALFKKYPNMKALSAAKDYDLYLYTSKVRGFRKKTEWLMKIANAIKSDKNIPVTMEELVQLPGIGRKSANVIMREADAPAIGVIVDLHVVRVAPRLGIAKGTDPKIIEEQIMEKIPQKIWGDTGMAISFLGRETCRPTNPLHAECVMNPVCKYYQSLKKKKPFKKLNIKSLTKKS